MDVRVYLQILRRRWAWVLACLLVLLAGAAVLTERATPQYESSAQLFISTPDSGGGGDAYQGGLFSEQRVASYAELVTGKELAQKVVNALHLSETPTALSQRVSSHVVPNTVLLDVTVRDPSPARAQVLANALARQFTIYVRQIETPANRTVSPIKATVVDTAGLPSTPVSPRPVRNIGLAAVLGLLLGLGVALLRDTLDNTVQTSQDVATATDAPMLGHIPFDPDASSRPLISELDMQAPRVEATRMLRTNLQFIQIDQVSKVLVITSSVPGEGKTTTAINLAIAIARAGQSVLLIEGDLRRPRVAEYLHLESTVGLTTILVGRVADDEAIQSWGDDGLDVVTSGARPPNPAELVQSHMMKEILGRLRLRYDVIIVDAPPLLPVTDASLLAAQSDGALLVVRHGKTTKDQLAQATRHLATVGAPLFGTVLNMTPRRRAGSYGYGYGYAAEEPKHGGPGARSGATNDLAARASDESVATRPS